MKIGEFLATADENMYSMEEWEKLVAYTFYVVEGECRKVCSTIPLVFHVALKIERCVVPTRDAVG